MEETDPTILEMEGRKWEDMNSDCLVNIFGRLELQSRVLVIPLVCKPWFQAVRNPLCWKQLVFPCSDAPRPQTGLIKFAVKRSQGYANFIALPNVCDKEDLIYVSEECPNLKTLMLPWGVCYDHKDIIPSLIVKWKNLEVLILEYMDLVGAIVELINIHLPNFIGLCLQNGRVNDETTLAIVSLLPKLKFLQINACALEKQNLIIILQCCKELDYLYVQNCIGFNEDDAEILKLSSGIKKFRCDGTIPFYYCDFDFDLNPDTIAHIADSIAEINIDGLDGIHGDGYDWDGLFSD